MLTEEMKKKALDKVKNLSAEELIARFEEMGSVRLQPGESFDFSKFMNEEMERLLGVHDDGWVVCNTYEVEAVSMSGMIEIHPCNDSPDGLAA